MILCSYILGRRVLELLPWRPLAMPRGIVLRGKSRGQVVPERLSRSMSLRAGISDRRQLGEFDAIATKGP
jgi:hypothetical protein